MRTDWLDSDDADTRVYAGPESAPRPLPRIATAEPAPVLLDSLEIPSLAYARQRTADKAILTPVTVALAVLCISAGVAIGAVIGTARDRAPATIAAHATPKPIESPTEVVRTTLETPAAVEPVAPRPPVLISTPKTADLRVESSPPGATVSFVGNGETTLVGTTPVEATVDAGRGYDVLVTLADHVSRIEHVAAGSTHHLVIELARAR
jgi:hypothetical protein